MGAAEAIMEDQNFHNSGLHRSPSTGLQNAYHNGYTRIGQSCESIDPKDLTAKEAGEVLTSRDSAISNAVFDAVGIRLRKTPFTPLAFFRH